MWDEEFDPYCIQSESGAVLFEITVNLFELCAYVSGTSLELCQLLSRFVMLPHSKLNVRLNP